MTFKLSFLPDGMFENFSTVAEPTVEITGAVDSTNLTVAKGGQVADVVDNSPSSALTVSKELITGDDSTFASDTGNWTKGAGVTIAGGSLVCSGSGGDASIVIGDLGTATYEVEFIIANYVDGTVTPTVGGTAGTARSANGTHTEDIIGGGTTTFLFNTSGVFEADITIVTITLKSDFRIDTVLNKRGSFDFLVVESNGLDAFADSLVNQIELYHNTSDNFGTATKVTDTQIISGMFNKDAPAIDFDGVDDDGVATDDIDLNPGRGKWSIECWARSTTADTIQIIAKSENGAADQWALQINSGRLGLLWHIDTSTIANTHFGGTSWADGELTHLVVTVDPAGNATGYVNGVAEPSTLDVSASDGLDMVSTSDFSIGAGREGTDFFFTGELRGDITLWNRIISQSEITARFNGGAIPSADAGAGSSYVSNFSGSSADGFTASRGAVVGDPASTGGETDNLKFTIDGTAGNHSASKAALFVVGETDNFEQQYFIPSANTDIDGILVGGWIGGQSNQTVLDTWMPVVISNGLAVGTPLTVFALKAGASSFTGNTTDVFYLRTVKVAKSGAVGSWTDAGLSESQGLLFDNINANNITLTGVEYLDAANEFFYMKFTQVDNALFWFLQLNSGDKIALADFKLYVWSMGLTATPTLAPDIKSVVEEDNFDGTEVLHTYSGGSEFNEKHSLRNVWSQAWSFLASADIATLQRVLAMKKRPFYFNRNADDARPKFLRGQILENVSKPNQAVDATGIRFKIAEVLRRR